MLPSWSSPVATDHPRIRGEHKYWATRWAAPLGSSPHTRGALPHEQNAFLLHGIIPAYAGSTRPSAPSLGRGPDHPRIRGEHAACPVVEECAEGSSPHTRGARQHGPTRK